jgi:hypothetical protein
MNEESLFAASYSPTKDRIGEAARGCPFAQASLGGGFLNSRPGCQGDW